MIHVYKAGGDFVYDKKPYSIRAINAGDLDIFLKDGWFRTLDEAIGAEKGTKQRVKKSEAKETQEKPAEVAENNE